MFLLTRPAMQPAVIGFTPIINNIPPLFFFPATRAFWVFFWWFLFVLAFTHCLPNYQPSNPIPAHTALVPVHPSVGAQVAPRFQALALVVVGRRQLAA